MELLTAILRLIITFAISFAFGMERQRAHKPIGFGTYVFVSVGSCGLAIVAISLSKDNPLPLLSAIVTGIGFLGAGALIRTADKIFGFSSAAGIWIFAILGLTIGVGLYTIGLMIYLLIWTIVIFDKYLQSRGIGSYQKRITLKCNRLITDKEVESKLVQVKHNRLTTEVDKANNKVTLTYILEGSKTRINDVTRKLYKEEWFESMKVE